MNATPARRLAAAIALVAGAASSPALALNDNPHGSAFVVLYQCDANRWIAVGYPAPFARGAEPPARLSWNGATVLMTNAASGSGARYVSKAADLDWRIKGREAMLLRLSDGGTMLANCRES
jgi:membrane-bound inhibitor of C-type lysozyme